jgi:hypothetical protein
MSLQSDLVAVLERERTQEATQQSRRVEEVSKLVDELVRKGVVDAPSYRLAPTTALPHRIAGLAKSRY